MSKFFDPRTRTLHKVTSYAGAVKIPKDIVEASIKVVESGPLSPARLRRCNAVCNFFDSPNYFSMDDHQIRLGNFNLSMDHTNDDLVPIERTITYK